MLKGVTVGCGFFGNIHLEGWRRVENADIVAVVDKDEERAKESASRFGLAAYTDLVQAIEETSPDFVDVATRPDSHLEIVETAAAQGCHVLCQKPIAPTWDESVQLVEGCKRHGVRMMIKENWRWQPWYRTIKKLIDADCLSAKTPFETEGEDYLRQVMRAVFAGYESAEMRKSVSLRVQKA